MEYLIRHLTNEGYVDGRGNLIYSLVDTKICRTKEIMTQRVDQITYINGYYELFSRIDKNHSWKLVDTNVPNRKR